MLKKVVFYMILFGLLMSCTMTTRIYYYDTSKFDDGEIWGDAIIYFFSENSDIVITQSNSKKLGLELINIKENVLKKGTIIEKDDSPYEFAFVTQDKDTLYSNGLIEWRYRNRKGKVSNTINKIYKKVVIE